jgi:hypothetical protein
MGKRELLIIAGFLVVGAIVYQFTAPPATGDSGFSFGRIFDEARREMRGNPGRAEVTHTGTIAAPASLRELRVLRLSRSVQVIGENRSDISYELTASSNGPDDATAKTYADRTVFEQDDLGDALVLRVDYPEEASQQTQAVIKVPARLAVRVESAVGVTVTGVAAVHVEAARGTVTLENISGAVTGMHQDGNVTITGAGAVKMRLSRLRSKLTGIREGLTLDIRDGECTVADSKGALEVDSTRAEFTVSGHDGTTIVRGADGSIRIDDPTREVKVDMRRADVEVATAGAAPITIITTDQTARLVVRPNASFALDALAIDSAIQAADLGLTPESADGDAKLMHTFGAGKTRVTIRNTRGDIVIRK